VIVLGEDVIVLGEDVIVLGEDVIVLGGGRDRPGRGRDRPGGRTCTSRREDVHVEREHVIVEVGPCERAGAGPSLTQARTSLRCPNETSGTVKEALDRPPLRSHGPCAGRLRALQPVRSRRGPHDRRAGGRPCTDSPCLHRSDGVFAVVVVGFCFRRLPGLNLARRSGGASWNAAKARAPVCERRRR